MFRKSRNEKQRRRAEERRRLCLILERQNVDLFVDVGANMGQTGRSLRDGGYAGRIISVEPVRACHDALLAASAQDRLWDIAERCAIGEKEGSVEIIVSEASDLSSLSEPTGNLTGTLPKAREAGREATPLRRIDQLLGEEIGAARRPFLKIDTQGHDMAALKSAAGVIDRIIGIQIEMSLLPLYEGETLYLGILNHLNAMGFAPYMLVERTFSDPLARQLQLDGVFIREPAGDDG